VVAAQISSFCRVCYRLQRSIKKIDKNLVVDGVLTKIFNTAAIEFSPKKFNCLTEMSNKTKIIKAKKI
jgi:hypothetical protein